MTGKPTKISLIKKKKKSKYNHHSSVVRFDTFRGGADQGHNRNRSLLGEGGVGKSHPRSDFLHEKIIAAYVQKWGKKNATVGRSIYDTFDCVFLSKGSTTFCGSRCPRNQEIKHRDPPPHSALPHPSHRQISGNVSSLSG